jgi:RNA polymerase sigma-70 factor (ECF subfamily)
VAVEAAAEDPLEPFRSELHAHCYRMLGSVHDAEDVLQEVSLRAWRGRQDFEGRASLRTWLHRIATNACLNELDRKERRVLPIEFGPAVETGTALYESLDEALWLEPLPDDPVQRAAAGESVELAFVAALQHLPANQRVALLMFDVLGFSSQEIAAAMATTSASVRSALQRARRLVEERLPERSQHSTLAALGDDGQRKLVARYTAALQQHDVEGMLALLTEDATWSMPPMPAWFRGHDGIAAFLAEAPFRLQWRHRPARANGQLAVGCFAWDEAAGAFRAYALDVLELRGDRIASVVSFIGGERFPAFGLPPALLD